MVNQNTEGFMDFENMLRQYFGDKSYGSQGCRDNILLIPREFKKVVMKIEKRVNDLDTTIRHKERMLNEVERLKKDLSQKDTDPYTMIIHLFSLISRLLGYDYLKGYINTPFYHQTQNQYYSQKIFEGDDVLQDYYDNKNLISLQKGVYDFLTKNGNSDFRIAQIMNTTEYQIKKLKKYL